MIRTACYIGAVCILTVLVPEQLLAQAKPATPAKPAPKQVTPVPAKAAQKPAVTAPAKPTPETVGKSPGAAGSARAGDEQAIRSASQAFAKAFESGDANAVGALFTDGAEYIADEGEPVRGRAELVKAYQGFFAKRKEVKATSTTDAIRFLGTDTAIEEGTFTVAAKDSPADSSRYSTLHVRQGGKWLMALVKEWADEEANKPTLQSLAWLIGTWESEGGDFTARTTYEWTANNSFIRAQYTITPKKADEQPSAGTQVIGVDPAVGNIRGWLFSSDGGIGESTWVWDGERWIIESIGTLADGTGTSAVNFLTRVGDGAFAWRSVQRVHDGESQADIPPVTVKRVAQAAASSPAGSLPAAKSP